MRVLITGAGMVGCHAAAALLARGDEVTVADLEPQPTFVRRVAGAVQTAQLDVRELPSVIGAVQAARPDVVVHTVALMSGLAQAAPHQAFLTNVGGALNVAEAVHRAGVRRLVHTSTLGVHDLSRPQPGPLDDDFPTGGNRRVYPASKVACEGLLRAMAAAHGFELVMLRLGAVYGFGHFAGGSGVGMAIHELLSAVIDGGRGDVGSGVPDPDELVYVKDVARGVALAVHATGLAHDTYNLGAGRLTTTDDLAAAVGRVVPGSTAARRDPPRPDPHPRRQPMALDRSRAELGYEPAYDLDGGLADLVAELRLDRPGRAVTVEP